MEPIDMTSAAWLAAGPALLALLWGVRRRRRAAAPQAIAAPEASIHRLELRMEAIEGLQAALAAQVEERGEDDASDRLQAMAGQILGLVRDKNASLDTALAGLDQLRARMRVLEQIGDPAEARALFERLGARLDALEGAEAGARGALEARLAALEGAAPPFAEISGQLTRLCAQKDASVETILARLAPLEAKLAEIERAREPEALERLAERLETLRAAQAAAEAQIAALRAPAENPFAEVSDQLVRLYAQKDAVAEALLARLAPVEIKLGEVEVALTARAPQAALERLEATQDRAAEALGKRLEALEIPFAEIPARLAAEKEAVVETVFVRLAPLEAKLEQVEGALAARDPQAALERMAERLEILQGRLTELEAQAPLEEIAGRLTRLAAEKDAVVETVFARLAPLETKLEEIEGAFAARDPQAALDRVTERLEALQGRVAGLEGAQAPFEEVAGRLARLAAEKDAAVETVFARLAPLEATLQQVENALAARDPQAALEALEGRVAGLEGQGSLAEVSHRLARLAAEKDAAAETVFARLAPLEAKLEEIEGALAARDPQAAFEALQRRMVGLEEGQGRFAEVSDRLARLAAEKDAAVDTAFGRLAPLEAKLGAVENALAARDPQAALERLEAAQVRAAAALGERLEALEEPFVEVSDRLARLAAEKDAALETVLGRLAPLETRLGELERAGADGGAAEARAEARAIAIQLAAARSAAEESRIFASRLSLLEASLPQLTAAQARMMEALERQETAQVAAAPTAPGEEDPFSRLPRVVSVQKI